jgi:hypothetical protein
MRVRFPHFRQQALEMTADGEWMTADEIMDRVVRKKFPHQRMQQTPRNSNSAAQLLRGDKRFEKSWTHVGKVKKRVFRAKRLVEE